MKDSTLGTIYAIKHSSIDYDEIIIDYWSNYTGTPKEYYTKEDLIDIAVNSFVDYIKTADNPEYVLRKFFGCLQFDCKSVYKSEKNLDDRVKHAIWTTLLLAQVRDGNDFVNGFRELKDKF